MSTSWFVRLASPGGRQSQHANASGWAKQTTARDPLNAFTDAWSSIERELAQSQRSGLSAATVQRIKLQLDRALELLINESRKPMEPIGPCLEHLLQHHVLVNVDKLVLESDSSSLRTVFVEWYSKAIVHFIKLLNKSIGAEVGAFPDEEAAVVSIMVVIAERIRTYPQLLAIFLKAKAPPNNETSHAQQSPPTTPSRGAFRRMASDMSRASDASDHESVVSPTQSSFLGLRSKREHDFILFAYLLRFVHREGSIGDDARAGLLSLIDIAMGASTPGGHAMLRTDSSVTARPGTMPYTSSAVREAALVFAEYLLDSDFAEVLGAGVAALFGLLPSKLAIMPPAGSGSSSTPGKTASQDPLNEGINSQGMVLGGMGALGDEDDPEEAETRRQADERALLASGVGIAGTEEFRESLDGWLKLVEFTQEVLHRLEDPHDDLQSADRPVDEDAGQQALVTQALSSSILSSLRTLFLQAVLYPSILESSDQDGSAVAVLSYLDALFDVVAEGTRLESTIFEFLSGDESEAENTGIDKRQSLHSDNVSESQSIVNVFLSPASNRVKRRKSSAMLIIERAIRQSGNGANDAGNYYTDSGRFTLQDLLSTNLKSSTAATVTAATKLLRTLLRRHDRWANAVLTIRLDETATCFSVMLRRKLDPGDEPVPTVHSEPDVFVYRPMPQSRQSFAIDLGEPLPPLSSIQTHHDALDVITSLLSEIDRTNKQIGSLTGSTGALANYLIDAEMALASEAGFRRGLLAQQSNTNEKAERRTAQRRRSSLFGTGQTQSLSARDLATVKTGYRHKLRPDSPVVSSLLDLLTQFFSHSPDVNLSLTAALATMALSPYRSLDDWLLPNIHERQSRPQDSRDDFRRNQRSRDMGGGDALSSNGDDRSDDFFIDELARTSRVDIGTRELGLALSPTKSALIDSDSVLAILSALAQSVSSYRTAVPQFDKRLSERRQGLFFADNLTDALELDSSSSRNLSNTSDNNNRSPSFKAGGITLAAPLPLPNTPQKSTGFASFITGRPRHARTTSASMNPFATPQKQTTQPGIMRRTSSQDSAPLKHERVDAIAGRQQKTLAASSGPASPFQAHYRQTSAITVTPIIVETPRLARKRQGGMERDFADVESADGVSVGSPSSHIGSQNVSSTTKRTSDDGSSSQMHYTRDQEQKHVMHDVSLSTILDNVIVLEEFVKELAAIVQVRRALGIDAVKFV
ncbi:hypothetical protein OIO90_004172 [Microbotryomycetes sp. JL221]|nr:hypothetical protein OIO90_004172 [Microbotryomycetes sp. JL221]